VFWGRFWGPGVLAGPWGLGLSWLGFWLGPLGPALGPQIGPQMGLILGPFLGPLSGPPCRVLGFGFGAPKEGSFRGPQMGPNSGVFGPCGAGIQVALGLGFRSPGPGPVLAPFRAPKGPK